MIMMVKYNINKKVKNMQSGMDMIMLCWGIAGKIYINMDDTGSSDNECSESSSGVFWRNILIFILIGSDGKF